MAEFPTIDKCNPNGRQKQSIVADLDGTLLRGRSSFPYMALVAFETGGILRLSALVLLSPLAALLYHFISEAAGIQLLVFVSIAGVRLEELQAVSRAVLPKFYCEDLHSETWNVFSACGRKIVVTANPRILVEYFLKEHLSVDLVIGTEIGSFRGRATGLVRKPGVMVGSVKAQALVQTFGEENSPDVGVGDRVSDYPFLRLCKESYIVPAKAGVGAVGRNKLQKPVIFHDGRLVRAPTPFRALLIVLWMPIGFLLACIRVAAGALLPMNIVYFAFWFLGVKVFIRGNPPKSCRRHNAQGVLFICTHRTLLDPIFVSVALGRPVSAVTYSLSRLSEVISPIKTYRLTRNREKDSKLIKEILEHGDLVLCPEGTTCREPFLLRFSALFAELTDRIVPVAVNNNMGMFHGTTARGWKGMDSFYFFMNPCPSYQLTFLNQLPTDFTCSGGRPSHEVANYIQRVLAATLGYECTTLTRKDKYRVLVGNDGSVAS